VNFAGWVCFLALASAPDEASSPTEVTWMFDFQEKRVVVQETWTLTSNSGWSDESITIALPREAESVAVVDGPFAHKIRDTSVLVHRNSSTPPTFEFEARYFLPKPNGRMTMSVALTRHVEKARLIVPGILGASFSLNIPADRSQHPVRGASYEIWAFGPLEKGTSLEFQGKGLPHQGQLFQWIAVGLCILIWPVVIVLTRKTDATSVAKLEEEDRAVLMRAIDELETAYRAGNIDEETYQGRMQPLIQELGDGASDRTWASRSQSALPNVRSAQAPQDVQD
jgi:hypothetical protein